MRSSAKGPSTCWKSTPCFLAMLSSRARINAAQIAGAQEPLLAGQIQDALDVGVGRVWLGFVPFIRRMQSFDEKKERMPNHQITTSATPF